MLTGIFSAIGDVVGVGSRPRSARSALRSFSSLFSDSMTWTGSRIVRPWSAIDARDRLANPPRRVGRELEAAAELEAVHRLHQADVAFLDQVEEGEAAIEIALGDRHDQPEVGFHQLALGLADDVLGRFDAREAAAELRPRQADARFERAAPLGALAARQLLERVELLVELPQLGDDVVDERRAGSAAPRGRRPAPSACARCCASSSARALAPSRGLSSFSRRCRSGSGAA